MRFKSILVITCACSLVIALSSCSISARIKRADKRYNIGEYYQAAEMYKQVYRQLKGQDKSLRAHVAFQQGECYRILNNSRAASRFLETLVALFCLI